MKVVNPWHLYINNILLKMHFPKQEHQKNGIALQFCKLFKDWLIKEYLDSDICALSLL